MAEETYTEQDVDAAYAAGIVDGKDEGAEAAEIAYTDGFDAGYDEAIADVKAAVENL